MDQVRSLKELAEKGIERVALTCGVFDGLHRGHQELVARMKAEAERSGALPVLFTFDPHPAQVLSPESAPRLLMSLRHKQVLLEEMGVKAMVLMPFNDAIAGIEPEAFVQQVLLESGLEVTAVVVGEKWRFGHLARGDLRLMQAVGEPRGIRIIGLPELHDDHAPISSTRIRQAIAGGELGIAERLLGRPFSILGEIYHGKGIGGSELHYPTANVRAGNELFPPSGIYAATARLRHDGSVRAYRGILYLGYSPTFVDLPPKTPFVEMHIFDFHDDIYGRELEVCFDAYIRPDARFPDANALCAQIALDIEQAKRIHMRLEGDARWSLP